MCRYLHGATNTSTLPGFPGDFHTDWEFFVNEFFDGNVNNADHAAMATKYRDIIVEGLKEYDNNKLTTEEYEALAWHGLSDTKYYRNILDSAKKQAIVDNREDALNKTTDSCN